MCIQKRNISTCTQNVYKKLGEIDMWTKPAATEMRFGFEVTMYVNNK
jgi:coenzyme PQQ precursor peptide PqqA